MGFRANKASGTRSRSRERKEGFQTELFFPTLGAFSQAKERLILELRLNLPFVCLSFI